MADLPVSPELMYEFFVAGAIGTKEFRSWLAKVDPAFNQVRDADVDNEIDRLARDRAEALRSRDTEQVSDNTG
jgi:hypothetical protein